MAKRFFGPHNERVTFAIERMRHLDSAQARLIATAMRRTGSDERGVAQRRALATAQKYARSPYWTAARSYGANAADNSAYLAEKVHYSDIHPGSAPWGLVREACRDAAAVAVISDVLDPGVALELAAPILEACPELRALILGRP